MTFSVDQTSPIPLYMQLQGILRQQISRGDYEPGNIIPSEPQLQSTYGISRITVRKAIEGLVLEGLLQKRRGIGTIVSTSPYVDDDYSLKGFTEKGLSHHTKVTTQVLEKNIIPASEHIAHQLQIEPDSNVLHVTRLRFSSDEPITLFENYLPLHIGIPDDYDFSGSIYYLLEHVCGIVISSAEKIITASILEKEEARLLGAARYDAALVIHNTTYDTQLRPVEYAEGLYRADRYQYAVHLKR